MLYNIPVGQTLFLVRDKQFLLQVVNELAGGVFIRGMIWRILYQGVTIALISLLPIAEVELMKLLRLNHSKDEY